MYDCQSKINPFINYYKFSGISPSKTINAYDINDYLDKALSLLRIIVSRNKCIRQPIITNYHSSFQLFGKRSFCVIHLDKKNIIINYSVNICIKRGYIYMYKRREERNFLYSLKFCLCNNLQVIIFITIYHVSWSCYLTKTILSEFNRYVF